MAHLETNKILVHYQHGFRSAHSCETQLITSLEDMARTLDHTKQMDVLILDFEKAFDTVAHSRLLDKLTFYGIRDELHLWIKTWLTQRSQRVVVNGETSASSHIKSGVPQGTVLGPLMFLLFINDIGENISEGTNLKLFADDSLLYRQVDGKDQSDALQRDLDVLAEWSQTWQLKFNLKKCYHLTITRKKSPYMSNYRIQDHILEVKDQQSYLGVELRPNLRWDKHICKITGKANQSLGFVRRNFSRCPQLVKKQAVCALVRPHLEYAATSWDPYHKQDIQALEMVQRRAARFVTRDYNRQPGSATKILSDLQWPTLAERRKVARLTLLHRAIHGNVAIDIPTYFKHPLRTTRNFHELRYTNPQTSSDVYKYSFFPRTIVEWNMLPSEILETTSTNIFKNKVSKYTFSFIQE